MCGSSTFICKINNGTSAARNRRNAATPYGNLAINQAQEMSVAIDHAKAIQLDSEMEYALCHVTTAHKARIKTDVIVNPT
jgi:hypothetical protein